LAYSATEVLSCFGFTVVPYPALNQALSAEVQRLKQAAGEASDAHAPNGSHHHMHRQILEQQLLQLQKQPSEAQKAEQQQPQESEQFKAQQKQWNH
jgi:hypothetical protein